MKFCFAIPEARIGGIRTFALNLGGQFRREGDEACAVIANRGGAARDPGDVGLLREAMEVRTVLQERVLCRSRFIRKVAAAINELRPDVLIVNHTVWGQAALPYL